MLNRKNLVMSFVVVLLLAMLAGCAAGDAAMPEGEVQTSMEDALAAQDKAMQGLMTGAVEWTEAEVSSLLTELIKQNLGDMELVTGVTAKFSDGQIGLKIDTAAGPVVLVGDVMVEDNIVQVKLDQFSAMGMAATGPVLKLVEGALNRALNSPELGVALNVEAGDGTLGVGLGQ